MHNATGGSVVLAMLLHAQVNTANNLVPVADLAALDTLYTDDGHVLAVQVVIAAAYTVIAAALVARHGTRLAAPGPSPTAPAAGRMTAR